MIAALHRELAVAARQAAPDEDHSGARSGADLQDIASSSAEPYPWSVAMSCTWGAVMEGNTHRAISPVGTPATRFATSAPLIG
jgi:hypothetical protein